MKTRKLTLLDLAIRVYPVLDGTEPCTGSPKRWRCPDAMLVIDTETRTDETQRLTFGSYRFFEKGRCTREGLFYADDLPASDCAVLEKYVATHKAETAEKRSSTLELLTRGEFVDHLFEDVYAAVYWSASIFHSISRESRAIVARHADGSRAASHWGCGHTWTMRALNIPTSTDPESALNISIASAL